METREEVLLDGEKVELPKNIAGETMDDDLLLLSEDMQTQDLSGVFENTQEIDWSKNE